MVPVLSVQENSVCGQGSPRAAVCHLSLAFGCHLFSNLVKLSFCGRRAPLHHSPPVAGKAPNRPSEHHQPEATTPRGRAGKHQWRRAAAVHGSRPLSQALPVPVPVWEHSLQASALAARGKAGARLAVTACFSPCPATSRDALSVVQIPG